MKPSDFGPYTEVEREEAMQLDPALVLTIIESTDIEEPSPDEDTPDIYEWVAKQGVHWVNALMFLRATKPLPPEARFRHVWMDENGQPVCE